MADKHSAAFWAGGAALIAGGGIFMAVTGFEPTKTPGTVWANSWFDLGFAFVILGLVITGVGVVMHFHREVQPGSAPPAVSATNGPPTATPAAADPEPAALPSAAQQPELASPEPALPEAVNAGPLLLTVEDEVWDLWRRAGYICALLLKITNTTGRAITVINYGVGTDWQRGPADTPVQISHESQQSLRSEARARERSNHYGTPLPGASRQSSWLRRKPRSVIPPNGHISGWMVTDCPRPRTGGTPRCTIKVTDALGNTYTKVIEQRDPQHYES